MASWLAVFGRRRVAIVTLLICACGGGDKTPPSAGDPCAKALDCPGVNVHLSLNSCPVLQSLLIAPTSLLVNEQAKLEVEITDPDGDLVEYEWTATAGTFSGERVLDRYTCVAAGQQVVTLWYYDTGGCIAQQNTEVFCGLP